MALTPQQIAEMDKVSGLTNQNLQQNRITELQSLRKKRQQEQQAIADQPKGFEKVIGKVADFTGGKELGQGLATAIMLPGASKRLNESLDQKIKMQEQMMDMMIEKKKKGEDISRLQVSYNDLVNDIKAETSGAEKTLNPYDLTTKQVLGDALQLGTTIVGAGTLPGATKTVTGATTIGKGIVQGAKTGAVTGAGFGAVTGASQGLQEDKSLVDIGKSTVGGALVGAGTGGLLGGITGGISGGIKSRAVRQATNKKDFVEDLVSPKATTAVKEQALREGRVTEQGLLSASKIKPSKRDLQIAEVVSDIVDSKKSLSENINLISDKVDEINSGVKAYVSANKVPFNTKQLLSQLNGGKDELKLIFAGDKQAERTYNAVVKEFLKNVKNKDTSGLFDARQTFDNVPAIKKLLDSQGLGENVKKEIVLTVRKKANEYVASLLPKGNQYRSTLLKESKMIEAITNMSEKGASSIGKNQLQELTAKYPILKRIAGGLGAGLGLGAIGVGGSIIGSTD